MHCLCVVNPLRFYLATDIYMCTSLAFIELRNSSHSLTNAVWNCQSLTFDADALNAAVDVRYWSNVLIRMLISKVMQTCICIAHRREVPLMCYRFPCVDADLHQLVHQPGIQRTLRVHGYGVVYDAICLFTPPAFTGYSFQPNHRGKAQAE